MTADSARREATRDDVLAAPQHLVVELIDGSLHLHPRPEKPHANATTVLGNARRSAGDKGAR